MLSIDKLKEIYRNAEPQQALAAIKTSYPKLVENYTQLLKATDSSTATGYLWASLHLIIYRREQRDKTMAHRA